MRHLRLVPLRRHRPRRSPAQSKYAINFGNAEGVQIGDGNVQNNTFYR